jgi:hypothetical protein
MMINFSYIFHNLLDWTMHSLFLLPGSGGNPRALEVDMAYFRNHRDHPLHLLCMGTISSGIVV